MSQTVHGNLSPPETWHDYQKEIQDHAMAFVLEAMEAEPKPSPEELFDKVVDWAHEGADCSEHVVYTYKAHKLVRTAPNDVRHEAETYAKDSCLFEDFEHRDDVYDRVHEILAYCIYQNELDSAAHNIVSHMEEYWDDYEGWQEGWRGGLQNAY